MNSFIYTTPVSQHPPSSLSHWSVDLLQLPSGGWFQVLASPVIWFKKKKNSLWGIYRLSCLILKQCCRSHPWFWNKKTELRENQRLESWPSTNYSNIFHILQMWGVAASNNDTKTTFRSSFPLPLHFEIQNQGLHRFKSNQIYII